MAGSLTECPIQITHRRSDLTQIHGTKLRGRFGFLAELFNGIRRFANSTIGRLTSKLPGRAGFAIHQAEAEILRFWAFSPTDTELVQFSR